MKQAALLTLSLVTAGCIHYQPQPLDLARYASDFQRRRLDDSVLVRFMEEYSSTEAGDSGWTARRLALAALWFRPEITRARAEWRVMRAHERTAASRPQPGAEAQVERAVGGTTLESPWVVSLAGLFTLELGGKRGARIQQARAMTAAAEAELRLAAWQVVRESRMTAGQARGADQTLAEATAEAAAVNQTLALEETRFEEATISSSELARARVDAQEAAAAVSAGRSALLSARAALARTVGIPPEALPRLTSSSDSAVGCDWLTAVGRDSAAAVALTHRSEMGRALAHYAIAEADLRLAVAQQYPDLDLGPGFIWDQGVHRWTMAASAPGLLASRNRGPIREAEARRTLAAAEAVETQETVLGELGTAAIECGGAAAALAAADSQIVVTQRIKDLTQSAFDRGEIGRLELARADLALLRARRQQGLAQRRLLMAAVETEGTVGVWLGAGQDRWPDPRVEPAAGSVQ